MIIKKRCKRSVSVDAIFMKKLLFNLEFKEYLYDIIDQYFGCQRVFCWKKLVCFDRPFHQFIKDDFETIIPCEFIFGLKSGGEGGMALIDKIEVYNKIL